MFREIFSHRFSRSLIEILIKYYCMDVWSFNYASFSSLHFLQQYKFLFRDLRLVNCVTSFKKICFVEFSRILRSLILVGGIWSFNHVIFLKIDRLITSFSLNFLQECKCLLAYLQFSELLDIPVSIPVPSFPRRCSLR